MFYSKKYYYLLASFMLAFTNLAISQSLSISGGDQNLTITTGTPGGQLTAITNINCGLTYSTVLWPIRTFKITVQTSCPGQSFNLSVAATNVSRGTAAPAVALAAGNPAADFITGISAWTFNATCRLNYTASATFAQGNSNDEGNDVHTVTYTIQQQ